MKPRPEVQQFALDMERVLQMNEHKGGWQSCPPAYLFRRLLEEVAEVAEWVTQQGGLDSLDFRHECVDVANFAMMLWDNSKRSRR